MAKPAHVLIYTNDTTFAFTKTTETLAYACRRLGCRVTVRDSYDMRLLHSVVEGAQPPCPVDEARQAFSARIRSLARELGVDCVLSLDLGWLFDPDTFLELPEIRRIYSLWFDDFHSWCRYPTNRIFTSARHSFQETIKHAKVCHCFYGEGLGHEARLLGIDNQLRSRLAAPQEFLRTDHPCEVRDRLAFVGNPGFRQPPSKKALGLLDSGGTVEQLRELAREEVISMAGSTNMAWYEKVREVVPLMATATAVRLELPHLSALAILQHCREAHPGAFDFLNEKGCIYDAAVVVKLVNRYDRPGLAYRLHKAGLADVISNPQEWEPWGIQALPSIRPEDLPAMYQRYVAQLNAANPLRDAPANEKLFEIAACARSSINLWSPDVADCFAEGEVAFVNSFAEAEERARAFIARPELAFSMGKKSRLRVAREHTWDHRLARIFERTFLQGAHTGGGAFEGS